MTITKQQANDELLAARVELEAAEFDGDVQRRAILAQKVADMEWRLNLALQQFEDVT